MKFPLIFLVLLISALPSGAQLSVQLQMDRKAYLANEAVSAVVTVTNRTGQELFLRTVPRGRGERSWLDFSVRKGNGRVLNKRQNLNFQAARIPAGQSVSKRIALNGYFNVNQPERYFISAQINDSDRNLVYRSNSASFTVSNGRTLYSQPFGAPGTKYPKREYKLLSFNDGKKTALYVGVHEAVTRASIQTLRLSEALLFHKPQATIDGKNRLHVLYLANPEVYVHVTVDRDGRVAGTEYYKRAATGPPRFIAFAKGEIKVRSGIPFNPQKARQERNRARRLSERPR